MIFTPSFKIPKTLKDAIARRFLATVPIGPFVKIWADFNFKMEVFDFYCFYFWYCSFWKETNVSFYFDYE